MYKIILCLFLIAFAVNNAQEYAGSEACKSCHSTQHTNWKASGHPYKVQKLVGGNGPVYPVLSTQKTLGTISYTLKSGIPSAPEGLNWSDIGFVLGGYHSNARFMDKEGYLIYGAKRQYNLSTNVWVSYTSGTATKGSYTYSCYKCHTTGPSKTKTTEFQPYPGIEGSWAEAGIGCEGCHGASKAHVSNVGDPAKKPTKDVDCSKCHARDRNDADATYTWNKRVEWQARTVNNVSTGFIRHREQGDMLLASKHGKIMQCATCHDAHKGAYFELGSVKSTASCTTCHPNKQIVGHESTKTKADCVDCHMPKGARNGDQLTAYVADQSTHYWKILTDPITMFDNLETINNTANPPVGYKFIKQDAQGMSGITMDYACIQCHTTKDIKWASLHGKSMHSKPVSVQNTSDIPSAYTLAQNYPNPFNPATSIKFALPKSSNVTLKVYAITGEVVATLINGNMNAGWHEAKFNASSLASGVYIYRIEAGDFAFTRKMMLIK